MTINNDAVDETQVTLCCAACCVHCGVYHSNDCLGVSGKVGLCCIDCEVCLKPGAPCLPLICCGPRCERDGCSLCKIQVQACCIAITGAFPCDSETPPAVNILGLNLYPKCGVCVPQSQIIQR